MLSPFSFFPRLFGATMNGMSQDMAGTALIETQGGAVIGNDDVPALGFSVNNGWIKIHRKITEWEWYQDDNTFRVFFHILMMTNHEDKKWKGVTIKRGQFLTGRIKLAQQLKLSEQSIRTALNKLKSTNEITILTTKQYSIITVQKWNEYQTKTDKSTNNQPTTNQQSTTTKKLKNVRKKEITSTANAGNEVNLLMGLFKPLNPSIEKMFGRPPQREACTRLLKTYGAERIGRALLFTEKCRGDRYCPVITTPIQLEDKWGALESYAMKAQKDIIKNKIVSV